MSNIEEKPKPCRVKRTAGRATTSKNNLDTSLLKVKSPTGSDRKILHPTMFTTSCISTSLKQFLVLFTYLSGIIVIVIHALLCTVM